MARRTILSDAELAGLLALPDTEAETIRRYTFNDADLAIIAQHRGPEPTVWVSPCNSATCATGGAWQ